MTRSTAARFLLLGLLIGVLARSAISPDETTSVSDFAKALKDKKVNVRREAAYALRRLGPRAKEAVPALVEALGDGDQQVWFASIEAIALIGPDAADAVPALVAGMKRPDGRGRRYPASAGRR